MNWQLYHMERKEPLGVPSSEPTHLKKVGNPNTKNHLKKETAKMETHVRAWLGPHLFGVKELLAPYSRLLELRAVQMTKRKECKHTS